MTELPDSLVLAPGPIALRELVGSDPALLIFFKGSCGTCQIALPVFQHWSSQIRVLGISQDDPETTTTFFDEFGIEMEVAFDGPTYEASAALDIEGVPAMYLVNGGQVTWSSGGWNVEKATELAGLIGQVSGTDPVLVGAEELPLFRPG